ncbi:MAG TPA: hypothetical protein VJX48_03270, partial [Xanthobacteraceae bacterium]|nr:hypothetical protein [Xanthobacteraceae bacterium]
MVFLSPRGPYDDRRGAYGGQIKKGRYGALARAGLDRELAPYDLRHTWASWHCAVHRDLLALKVEGGWSSVALVERYAHLLPQGTRRRSAAFSGTRPAPIGRRCGQVLDKSHELPRSSHSSHGWGHRFKSLSRLPAIPFEIACGAGRFREPIATTNAAKNRNIAAIVPKCWHQAGTDRH